MAKTEPKNAAQEGNSLSAQTPGSSPDAKPTTQPPLSKLPKLSTSPPIGYLLSFLIGLGAIYMIWPTFIQKGGTGSNVVLVLLVACVAVYVITTNLGPFFQLTVNRTFFGKSSDGERLERQVVLTWKEFFALLKRIEEGKERNVKPNAATDVRLVLNGLSEALRKGNSDEASLPEKARLALYQEVLEEAEACANQIFTSQGSKSFWLQTRSLIVAFSVALALRAFVVEPFQIPSGSMIPTLLIGDHLFVARSMYGLTSPFSSSPEYLVRWSIPEPGDVVVFVAPPHVGKNAGEDWIKRVIAGPGQTVKISKNVIYVDGKPYEWDTTNPEKEVYDDHDELGKRWYETEAFHVREKVRRSDGTHHTHSMYLSYLLPRDWPPAYPGAADTLLGLTCEKDTCTVNEGHIFVMGDNRDHSKDGRSWGAVPVDNVKGKALFVWMSVDGSSQLMDVGRFTLPQFRWERLFMSIE